MLIHVRCSLLAIIYAISVECFLFDHPDGAGGVNSLPALAEPPLKIASFNIQVFGVSKFSHSNIVDILVKILSRYDIIQILEIRDSTNTVFEKLRLALNKYVNGGDIYDKVVSARLGRSSSKEQYGFLYRPSKVTVTDTYQYQDRNDYFEREPFSVKFKSNTTVIEDFVMMANHIQPSSAAEEMDNLTRVYETVKRHWGINDVIISGDFNADCNYLSLSKWKSISLRNDPRFLWLMPDDVDTTVATSQCSYDRGAFEKAECKQEKITGVSFIETLHQKYSVTFAEQHRWEHRKCAVVERFVVAGASLLIGVVSDSVKAYRFDEEMGLTKQQGLDVSDHYPIEMELKGKPNMAVQQSIHTSISFSVKDTVPVTNVNDIRGIYRSPSCAGSRFTIKLQKEGTHMDFVQASFSIQDPAQILPTLMGFRSNCPGTLSLNLLAMTNSYVESQFLKNTKPTVYGLTFSLKKTMFDVKIVCSLLVPYVCEISVARNIS